MAKLRRRIIETTVRWEETENLTPEQVEKWKTGGYDIQEEVMDEVRYYLFDYWQLHLFCPSHGLAPSSVFGLCLDASPH